VHVEGNEKADDLWSEIVRSYLDTMDYA